MTCKVADFGLSAEMWVDVIREKNSSDRDAANPRVCYGSILCVKPHVLCSTLVRIFYVIYVKSTYNSLYEKWLAPEVIAGKEYTIKSGEL